MHGWALMAVRWDARFNCPSLFLTSSIAKNRNAKGYSPNALPDIPEISCAPTSIKITNIHQKSELMSPDLSTVKENENPC